MRFSPDPLSRMFRFGVPHLCSTSGRVVTRAPLGRWHDHALPSGARRRQDRPPSRASRRLARLLLLVLLLAVQASPLLAATSGTDMPWNQPLQRILDNLTGPTGKTIAALMIIIGGLVWGFTRHEQGMSRIGGAIVAIGLVLGAPSFIETLGFQGAILREAPPAAASSRR